MAGHSKWANIKHRKGRADAARGKVFSRIAKEITVSARLSGGDPSSNITLRSLITKAKSANMPNDNIDRAIKKGTGDLEGAAMKEIVYEGFAVGGVSVVISCLTDNNNRTAASIRHLFTKHGGNLGAQGSVTRSYSRKGQIFVDADSISENKLIELALEAGAEDVQKIENEYEVLTDPNDFYTVVNALTDAEVKLGDNEITMIPEMEIKITDKGQASQILKFMAAIEEDEDVQNVYSNFDIDESIIDEVSGD